MFFSANTQELNMFSSNAAFASAQRSNSNTNDTFGTIPSLSSSSIGSFGFGSNPASTFGTVPSLSSSSSIGSFGFGSNPASTSGTVPSLSSSSSSIGSFGFGSNPASTSGTVPSLSSSSSIVSFGFGSNPASTSGTVPSLSSSSSSSISSFGFGSNPASTSGTVPSLSSSSSIGSFGFGSNPASTFSGFESKKTNIASSDVWSMSFNGGGGSGRSLISKVKRSSSSVPFAPQGSASPPPQKNEKTTIHDAFSAEVANHNTTSSRETVKEVISLKLAVEKKKNRVVFAESNNDFIDVIFSFLTLPIGSILSLLQGNSSAVVIGCMNNLYESVGHLDARLFMTEACKEMLLHPRRLSEAQCRKLKLQFDKNLETPKCFYFCRNLDCRRQGTAKLSDFPNAHCHCGQLMDQLATFSEQADSVTSDAEGGVFVKGGSKLFLITDNIQVMPGLTSLSIQFLKKLGITDANELEMQNVVVGPEKVIKLLGLSFVSRTPLTHWILSEQYSPVLTKVKQESSSETSDEHSETNDSPVPTKVEEESSTGTFDEHSETNDSPVLTKIQPESSSEAFDEHSEKNDSKKMRLVLFISKSQNTILYAECEEDFVDFLFSFLSFPLASIVKILDSNSQLGSFDNLYRSVTDLGIKGHLKSEQLKDMLLCPKLAPYLACDNQLLRIEESCHPEYKLSATGGDSNIEWFVQPASAEYKDSIFGGKIDLFSVINPRSPAGESKQGGGFLKGPAKFMVTDDLTVTLLSPIGSISFIGKSNVPISDVDEMSVEVGVEEGKCLLRAALISKTALTDVFRKKKTFK